MKKIYTHPAINKRFCMPVAVYLIIEKDDNVLLLKRFNTGYEDGNYSLISGCVDGNESISDAAIREAKEEAGITLSFRDLSIPTVMHRSKSQNQWEALCFFFKVKSYQGEINNTEPHKCSELKFFKINNLPHNLIPYVKEGLISALNNKSYIEYGF